MRFNRKLTVFKICLLLLVLVESASPARGEGRSTVIVSFFTLEVLIRPLAAERVEVERLVPVGQEAHDYEPTLKDVERLRRAAMFVYNGAGFEPWVEALLERGVLDPERQLIVEATRPLQEAGQLLPAPEGSGFVYDPHAWTDPVRVQAMISTLEAGLRRLDPAGHEGYTERGRAFRGELAQLDLDIQAGLAACRHRTLVISHRFFDYFADRYGLVVEAASGLEPEEPTLKRLEALFALVRERDLRYLFAESPEEAERTGLAFVAKETGARLLYLHSLEEPPERAGETEAEAETEGGDYLSAMQENLRTLRLGLECD